MTAFLTNYRPPVVIGGIGGSGTRLIAKLLRNMGFFLGSDLNGALDNHWFTLLFKRKELAHLPIADFSPLIEIFCKAMTGQGQFSETEIQLIHALAANDRGELHPSSGLKPIAESLLASHQLLKLDAHWGWKEPNTHLFIEPLHCAFPKMKYIHVARHGLDMAYSQNQNQLLLWGDIFLESPFEISAYYSLKYWCKVQQRIFKLYENKEAQFLFLNYDQFCANPQHGMQQLLEFLELDLPLPKIKRLIEMISLPESVGRFKNYDKNIFDAEDIAFVQQLGFDVT